MTWKLGRVRCTTADLQGHLLILLLYDLRAGLLTSIQAPPDFLTSVSSVFSRAICLVLLACVTNVVAM